MTPIKDELTSWKIKSEVKQNETKKDTGNK